MACDVIAIWMCAIWYYFNLNQQMYPNSHGAGQVIFMCSATKIGPNKFRLFFGGGDGNVGTGVVQVSDL